jgi:hypothetical protein
LGTHSVSQQARRPPQGSFIGVQALVLSQRWVVVHTPLQQSAFTWQ